MPRLNPEPNKMNLQITEAPRTAQQVGILIFTFPPDFSLAARAVNGVCMNWHRTGMEKTPKFFWCIHKKHTQDAKKFISEHWTKTVPSGTPTPELIEHEFDAGGHLQCLSACGGMKWVFWHLFHDKEKSYGIDAVIKMDSDVILLRPEQWIAPWAINRADYVYIPQAPCEQFKDEKNPLATDGSEPAVCTHLGCGWAYLVSRDAAGVIGNFPADKFKQIVFRNYGAEDRVFGRVLQESIGVITAEISPKNVIGKSFESEPDAWTAIILDNPKDNYGKVRYSWNLSEFFNEQRIVNNE